MTQHPRASVGADALPVDANDAHWNALLPDDAGRFPLRHPDATGPLSGLRVAVKDLFAIAGLTCGAGNPDWLATHEPASAHASAVDKLLAAGASIVGRALTDELAYSLNGENHHYGTPVNPVDARCIPGGSSCGSAVATGAGLCDIGLGTDTAGSIRLPATFCGLWGLRPTHGAVDNSGVVGLAPSYDAVGWMSRNHDALAAAGDVLLPADSAQVSPQWLSLPTDAWALADDDVRGALAGARQALADQFGQVDEDILAAEGFLHWQQVFRTIQGYEVWQTHGDWITRHQPRFGPGIQERFAWAATIHADDAAQASQERARLSRCLDERLAHQVIALPTVSFRAPFKGSPASEDNRTRALCLLSVASLAGLPQVSWPVRTADAAYGLSLIGPRGSDRALMKLAAALANQ